jgi:hypothetical protein
MKRIGFHFFRWIRTHEFSKILQLWMSLSKDINKENIRETTLLFPDSNKRTIQKSKISNH